MQSYIYSLLFDRDNKLNKKKLIFKKKIDSNKNKKEISDKVSKKCLSLLTNIYDKMNTINSKAMELNQFNSISLQKISQKYYRMNTSKSYSSIKNIKGNNLVTINSTQSTYYNSSNNFFRRNFGKSKVPRKALNNFIKSKKIKSEENMREIESYQNKNYMSKKRILSSVIKKKKENKFKSLTEMDINELYNKEKVKKINMERFNDILRADMNNTFYNFNPKGHLKKINEMQRDNVSLRQDIENLKQTLNDKIEKFSNKNCLINNYNNKITKPKNKNILSARNLLELPTKIPFNIKIKNPKKLFPNGYKVRALYEYQAHSLENEKKKENIFNLKQKYFKKNQKFKIKKELLDKTLQKLMVSLNTNKIDNYIDEVKNEKVNKNEEISQERKKKYFPELNDVKECLIQCENNEIHNDKKEEIEKKIIYLEHSLLKNIKDIKDDLIENIN